MKKFATKVMIKELMLKEKVRSALADTNGSSTLTDNAGVIIIGVVLIAAILVWALSFVNKDFLPALKDKIMGLLNQ